MSSDPIPLINEVGWSHAMSIWFLLNNYISIICQDRDLKYEMPNLMWCELKVLLKLKCPRETKMNKEWKNFCVILVKSSNGWPKEDVSGKIRFLRIWYTYLSTLYSIAVTFLLSSHPCVIIPISCHVALFAVSFCRMSSCLAKLNRETTECTWTCSFGVMASIPPALLAWVANGVWQINTLLFRSFTVIVILKRLLRSQFWSGTNITANFWPSSE